MALAKPCEHKHHKGCCTSNAAAFESACRLELANAAGFSFKDYTKQSSRARAAGRHADIRTLQLAVELGLQLTRLVVEGAVESNDVQKLEWLRTDQHCCLPQDVTLVAARARSADILRWLQQSGCEFTEHTSYATARTANNLQVLQFLHENGCPINRYACNAAVAAGDLEQLQWLHARGASLTAVSVTEVVKGVSVSVAHWLLARGLVSVLSERTMELAAGYGNTDFCRSLRSMGCPWSVTMDTIAHCASCMKRGAPGM
jgi:hypothetical protein